MPTPLELDQVADAIGEADADQLTTIFVEAVRRLGNIGREAREAVQLALSYSQDTDLIEGIQQLVDAVDGIVP
jgi:hypothetical protein